MDTKTPTPGDIATTLATRFVECVWGGDHDLDVIDELMTEDYRIWSGGQLIQGRDAFKAWVRTFQAQYGHAHSEIMDVFADAAGTRVVARFHNTGINQGLFGLPADGRPVSFSGIAIWRVQDGRLAECWVERAGLEAYRALTGLH